MSLITLSHFTPTKFTLRRKVKYTNAAPNDKPQGLWLSDESDHGWKQWCKSENFYKQNLKFNNQFKCDTSNWLHLDSPAKILKFSKEFGVEMAFRSSFNIDWARVSSLYSGILITPYQWKCRHHEKTRWYYGWDVASACVWDLSSIKRIYKKS